jgi:hypothetical protein
MKSKYRLLKIIGWVFPVLIIASCSKKVDNATSALSIKTLDPSFIDFESAMSGGIISSPGSLPLLEKGICYNTSPGPTISDSVIFSKDSSNTFTCTLNHLRPATRYYIRAFAKNDAGTFYGNEVSLTMFTRYGLNNYDATYYPNLGAPYAYHVSNLLYQFNGQNFDWETYIYARTDTFYRAKGKTDTLSKGCIALVSNIDSSQQSKYNYYIGSYYKFSLFNDTAVGNLQFMVPTDQFPSVDSIPVGVAFMNFSGGLNSFYRGMTKCEVKVAPDKDFVQFGDSVSYANPLIPAQGNIDSAEIHLLIRRFSDNGFHPNSGITKTMDGHVYLNFYFHDGSRFTLINCEFTNIPFQKASM